MPTFGFEVEIRPDLYGPGTDYETESDYGQQVAFPEIPGYEEGALTDDSIEWFVGGAYADWWHKHCTVFPDDHENYPGAVIVWHFPPEMGGTLIWQAEGKVDLLGDGYDEVNRQYCCAPIGEDDSCFLELDHEGDCKGIDEV